MPSAQKLSNIEFKNNFLNNYNNSFAHFCGINKDEAEKVLAELSQERGLIGFTSEMTLKEWKKKNKIN